MKKFFKGLRVVLLVTVLVIGAGLVFLLSPAGLDRLTPLINSRLTGMLGRETRIEGLRRVHPLGVKFVSLQVTHEDRTVLRVEGFEVRASARALLKKRVHVHFVSADEILFSGWPSDEEEMDGVESSEVKPFPDLEALFERVVIEELSFPRIVLAPPLLEEEGAVDLRGRFVKGVLDVDAEIEMPDSEILQALLRVARNVTSEGEQILEVGLKANRDDMRLDMVLALVNHPPGQRVIVQSLEGKAFERAFRLENPLVLDRAEDELVLSETSIHFGEGRLDISGSMRNEELQLYAEVLDLPLAMLGFSEKVDPDAAMKANLEVAGTLSEPTANLQVLLSGLKPSDSELWEGDPASLNVTARLGDGRGTLDVHLSGLPGDPIHLILDTSLRVSLQPFAFDFPEDEPVHGSLKSSTDLEGLSRLFVLEVYHRLSGRLDVDMVLEGTLNQPVLRGTAQVFDGAYEHELTGFQLRDLDFAVSAQRDLLRLDHFQASDATGGRIMVDGQVSLEMGPEMRFEADVTLRDFQAVRQDELEVVVNGDVRISGGRAESKIEGQLTLRPVEIRIPERMPHTVRTIEVVERFEPGREEEPDLVEASPPRHRMRLDLLLEAPDRIFVRGRGLNSEWSARLRLRGEVSEPVLTGDLTVLRGRFLFFGKRLSITRGRVTFDGAFPADPLLDVMAELRSGGIVGMLGVTGAVSDPVIELSSTPPLPEDEVLARLLFGRESARITPWQAVTLARAVNEIRGGGSAFDIMGTTRRMLQVDQIEIRTDEAQQGDARVAVGRYIGDRIYVELERGVEAESGRARVEVELTPTLRLETQTGLEADSGVGLRWRWDY